MHPDATDSSGAGPAAALGAPGERRPEPGADAAAPRGPGGGGWRVPVAVAVLAAASLSYLGPGGAGGAVLLRLSLYLMGSAAAFLLGTLFSLVCRSRRAPPPDFAAAWRRLAARRRPRVSTGLAAPRARPARFRRPPPAPGAAGVSAGPSAPARRLGASSAWVPGPGSGSGLRAARAGPGAAVRPVRGGRRAGGSPARGRCARRGAFSSAPLTGGGGIWGPCRRTPEPPVRRPPRHPAPTMLRSRHAAGRVLGLGCGRGAPVLCREAGPGSASPGPAGSARCGALPGAVGKNLF